MIRSVLVLGAITITLFACGRPQVVEIAEAPTTAPVVTLTARQLDAAPVLQADEVVRIRGEAATPNGFSRISGIGVTNKGDIVVLEGQQVELRVYDVTGSLLRRFSGKGGGPGEMKSPMHMVVARDTIYVYDDLAIVRFTVGGEYIGRERINNAISSGGRNYSVPALQSLAHTGEVLVGHFPKLYRNPDGDAKIARDTFNVQIIDPKTGGVSRPVIPMITSDKYRLDPKSGFTPRPPGSCRIPFSRLRRAAEFS